MFKMMGPFKPFNLFKLFKMMKDKERNPHLTSPWKGEGLHRDRLAHHIILNNLNDLNILNAFGKAL